MVNWDSLQQTIGVPFQNQSLLQQAFVHLSYSNENPDFPLPDNERLEFLGDALLSFIVTEKLYQEFPHLAEGELTEMRISLIRQETLADLASSLELGDYLYLGKGEEATGGRERQTNLADTFEALIASIFLDQGLTATKNFVLARVKNKLEALTDTGAHPNYKALLQELTQSKHQQMPFYRLKETLGPDHDKIFTVDVMVEGKILGTGSGKSKKTAEMEAANFAWENLKNTNSSD